MVRITVIIPTQDRPYDLRRCLSGLRDNDLSSLEEVIVVDDASRDPATVADFSNTLPLRLIRNAIKKGAAASRNLAAAAVKTDIIAFLDDDALPSADWLATIKQEMTLERGGITGRVLRFDAGLTSAARQARYNLRYRTLTNGQPVPFFSGGNSAIWAELFRTIGGFNHAGSGGDNAVVGDLAQFNLGIHFVPDMVVLHRNSKGWAKAVQEAYNSGRSHPKRLGIRTAMHMLLTAEADGDSSRMATAVNWGLNLVHISGRVKRRRTPSISIKEG